MHQGSFKHTIDDIQERTGLSRHFINRCSSKIPDILDPYRQYGDNNQLFYDDSGLLLWDHISQLKREGKTIPEMKRTLEKQLRNRQNSSKSTRKSSQKAPQNLDESDDASAVRHDTQTHLIDALREAFHEISSAKDAVIESKDDALQSKEQTIHSLQQNLTLLTDGRDAETVKEEHERKIEEAAKNKEKVEQMKEEKRRREQRQERRKQRRTELLAELRSLDGKWFKARRRKDIIAELERLDQADGNGEESNR